MRNPRVTKKELGLIKGALRRVFSRSELRKQALDAYTIDHYDSERPRVTKWAWCPECGQIYPRYLTQVDHQLPIIAINETLEDLTFDELVNRLWCDLSNLKAMDKDCHKEKTKAENKARREFKKGIK